MHAWSELTGEEIAGYKLRKLVYGGRRQAEFLALPPASEEGAPLLSVWLFEGEAQEIEQELARIAQARQLQHPNLLCLLDGGCGSVLSVSVLYIVTEAIEGTLAQRLADGPLALPETKALLDDLLAALVYLHMRGLVYRSLSPETVVRKGGRWKLGDLGDLHAAGRFPPPGSDAPGPSRHVPPEAAAGSILPAWDIWTLGFTLQDVLGAGQDGAVLPPPFDAVVRGCLDPEPGNRLIVRDIRRLVQPVAAPPSAAKAALPVPTPAPAVSKPAPAVPKPAPVVSKPAPVVSKPAPVASKPVPAVSKSAPTEFAIPQLEKIPAFVWPELSRKTIFILAGVVVLFVLLWLLLRGRSHTPTPAQLAPTTNNNTAVSPASPGTPQAGRPSPFSGKTVPHLGSPVEFPAAQPARSPATPAQESRVAKAPATSAAKPVEEPKLQPAGQRSEVGQADFLSDQMEGRLTASGERFKGTALSAAHRDLPLGTRVRVTNLENNRSVILRVNDRGAYRRVIISVTRSAAEQLGFVTAGSARVRVDVVQ